MSEIRWDWYQATLHRVHPNSAARSLMEAADLSDIRPGRAKNGYLHAWDVKRGDHLVASVWWGGNPGVHVLGTGEDAPLVASVLARGRVYSGWEVLPTRVDACMDWVKELMFSGLAAQLIQYALDNEIKIDQKGDWERCKGRTLYLGSRSSVVQLVLYEKGYQTGAAEFDPRLKDWVRLEVRVYPAKHARASVAEWGPGDAFSASKWVVGAMDTIGWRGLEPYRVGNVWRPADDQRARLALIRQYARIMQRWSSELGGWAEFGSVVDSAVELMAGSDRGSDMDHYLPLPKAARVVDEEGRLFLGKD